MVFGQDLGLADGLEGVAPEDRLTSHHRLRSGVGRGGGAGWEEKFGEKNNFPSSQRDPKKIYKKQITKLQIHRMKNLNPHAACNKIMAMGKVRSCEAVNKAANQIPPAERNYPFI